MAEGTRRLRFTETRVLMVDLPADEAANVMPRVVDGVQHWSGDEYEAYARFVRAAHSDLEYIEADLSIDAADGEEPFYAKVLDGTRTGGYLWTARHFIGRSLMELMGARYREGPCRDVDELRAELVRIEERLRVMALEAGAHVVHDA